MPFPSRRCPSQLGTYISSEAGFVPRPDDLFVPRDPKTPYLSKLSHQGNVPDLRHFELVEFPVEVDIHVISDEVAPLAAGPEGDALLGDVDRLAAGPRLAVHPDLEVVHGGDLLLELGELVVQFPPPELNISSAELEFSVNLKWIYCLCLKTILDSFKAHLPQFHLCPL